MAPPSKRRTGHSRRAQYGNFMGYVLAASGVLAALVALSVSFADPRAFSGIRGMAGDAVAPVGSASSAARSGSAGLWSSITGYFAAGSQNARLRKELDVAKVKLAEAAAVREENLRLKAVLGLAESDPRPVAVAHLVASTSASSHRIALIDAGSSQGVRQGMPVRSPLGLIGRVLETGADSAQVLLVTDTQSVVPVRRAGDGVAALATGRADGTIQLRLLNLGINPLKRGDVFVTSGSGGLYRPNTAIAVVARITTDGAIARPLSDPGATEFVIVEPAWDIASGAGTGAAPAPAAKVD